MLVTLGARCFGIAADHGPGEVRQRLRVDDGSRVAFDEGLSYFVAGDFRCGIAGCRQHRDTFFSVVRIRSQHVNGVVLE